MKKIIKNILFLGLVFIGFSSCTKEFLDTVKIGEQTEGSFYTSDEELVTASNALYAPLWEYHYNWGRVTHNSATTDDALDREDLQYHNYTFDATHFLFSYNYKYNYRGILIANKLLFNIEGKDISGVKDKELQKRIVAEAKFMRAYYYFDLVKKYGGVPLVDHPLKAEEFQLERSTGKKIYEFIEADLKAAIIDLPTKAEMQSIEQVGRATKGAAYAMLMKAAVSQASPGYSSEDFYNSSKWDDVKTYFKEFDKLGYSLYVGDYHDIFTEDGENGSGSVFEVQFYDSPLDDGAYTNNGNFTTFLYMPFFGGADPYGRNQTTYDLYLAFEEGDPRREASLINTMKFADTWILKDETPGVVQQDFTSFYNYKHYLSKEQYTTLGNFRNSPVNERIIRLSDVYLMYAEACINTGDDANALLYINMVRSRARGAGTIPADLGTVTKEDIYKERRVELCNEGGRWHDLVRLGLLEQELKIDGYKVKAKVERVVDGDGNVTDYIVSDLDGGSPVFKASNIDVKKHMYYPIPQSEVDNTNGKVIQNYGY